jgi:Na+/H+-dicarboxylate symporter
MATKACVKGIPTEPLRRAGTRRFVKEEFLIVLGTSSSEAAMPALMKKLELLGCGKSLVGLTVPLG